ncbi:proline dehydrogenase [Oleoguttula sp. CCFEE 5521]
MISSSTIAGSAVLTLVNAECWERKPVNMKTAVRVPVFLDAVKPSTRHATIAPVPIIAQGRRHTTAKRRIHSSQVGGSQSAILPSIQTVPTTGQVHPPKTSSYTTPKRNETPCLSTLPLSQVLRTYLITAISSSPALLGASSNILRHMLDSKSLLFSLERNPIARAILLETFFKQFCVGPDPADVRKICQELRQQGYAGVILEYALEVLKDAEGNEVEDVATWKKGMLDSVSMAQGGDFVAMKWSGMGPAALRLCAAQKPPSKIMDEAMHAVCKAAAAKDLALLPSAEETWNLDGYHAWTIKLQREYNRKGRGVIYNTYQCYLHQTPVYLARHLKLARQENFTHCAKLVRGAYLSSEPRELIQPTIEATHAAYDGVMSALIERRYNDILRPLDSNTTTNSWPESNVMLATHNAETVALAQTLRRAQTASSTPHTPLVFAQLQGMADEVSMSLIASNKGDNTTGPSERVFKATNWGTMEQCLNYLLRRAAENKDAASRTAGTRRAMGSEIWRRSLVSVGMA